MEFRSSARGVATDGGPVSKLAGPPPQPRVRPARSFPAEDDTRRYSWQERPGDDLVEFGGHEARRPPQNAGRHGYSICRAVFSATSLPTSLPTTCRLMSMPAAVPAEQTTRPLSKKRRPA
jgi:hypothetical protein